MSLAGGHSATRPQPAALLDADASPHARRLSDRQPKRGRPQLRLAPLAFAPLFLPYGGSVRTCSRSLRLETPLLRKLVLILKLRKEPTPPSHNLPFLRRRPRQGLQKCAKYSLHLGLTGAAQNRRAVATQQFRRVARRLGSHGQRSPQRASWVRSGAALRGGQPTRGTRPSVSLEALARSAVNAAAAAADVFALVERLLVRQQAVLVDEADSATEVRLRPGSHSPLVDGHRPVSTESPAKPDIRHHRRVRVTGRQATRRPLKPRQYGRK